MILPYDANPGRMEFSERTGVLASRIERRVGGFRHADLDKARIDRIAPLRRKLQPARPANRRNGHAANLGEYVKRNEETREPGTHRGLTVDRLFFIVSVVPSMSSA